MEITKVNIDEPITITINGDVNGTYYCTSGLVKSIDLASCSNLSDSNYFVSSSLNNGSIYDRIYFDAYSKPYRYIRVSGSYDRKQYLNIQVSSMSMSASLARYNHYFDLFANFSICMVCFCVLIRKAIK